MGEGQLKHNLGSGATWRRGLYILLFAVLYGIAEILVVVVVLFQFGALLLSGHSNARLLGFGRQLSVYLYQILLYVTFNSELRPYPFGPWPGQAEAAEEGAPERDPWSGQ